MHDGGSTTITPLGRESTSGLSLAGSATSWTIVSVVADWLTDDAWPSSLPGSAA